MSDAASDGMMPRFGGYKAANENFRTLAGIVFSKQMFSLTEIVEEYNEAVKDREDKSLGGFCGIREYIENLREWGWIHKTSYGHYRMAEYGENRY